MSDNIKLIIEIPKEHYQELFITDNDYILDLSNVADAVKNGIPLDSNSERAEVQAYFDGEAYGWEQGRKALLDDVKAEINKCHITSGVKNQGVWNECVDSILRTIDYILSVEIKAESGLKGWTSEEMLEQIRKENNDNPEDIGCDHND